jgi:hypothetical protein
MAATAAETRFRIEYPFQPRDSRIVAVDAGAAAIVCRAFQRRWEGSAHFLTFEAGIPIGSNGSSPDATLLRCDDGSDTLLSEELEDADVVVMVATSQGAEAATVIGQACAERSVMTAGVVITVTGDHPNAAVLALRPFAMVLVVSMAEDDLFDLLTALRV